MSVGGVEVAYPLFHSGGGGSSPTSTLSLQIDEIPMERAQELNQAWHSLLPRTNLSNLKCGKTSVAYGAYAEGEYWAVAIWSQPIVHVMDDGKTIELRRLAVRNEAPVNTATRMLGIMRRLLVRRWPHLTRLISYLALDVHQGTIYKAAGWKPVGEITEARPQRFTGQTQRATAPLQTTSRKQRWEYHLD